MGEEGMKEGKMGGERRRRMRERGEDREGRKMREGREKKR